MSMWDEINDILAGEDEAFAKSPLWMDLTPNGKTLVVVYPGRHQEEIIEALFNTLGEPEEAGPSEDYPGNLLLLFPHQNLQEDIKDIAERMTTRSLLRYLGVGDNVEL